MTKEATLPMSAEFLRVHQTSDHKSEDPNWLCGDTIGRQYVAHPYEASTVYFNFACDEDVPLHEAAHSK